MRSDVMRAPLAHTDAVSSTSTARRAWLRAVLALSLGASALGRPSATRADVLAVGQPAPSLVLHTLDGRNISTADLLGKVIILTFWATWCEPCRDELPLLSAYAARNADRGLKVLGFSLDGADNLSAVREVAASLSFPVGLLGSAWAGDYGRMWRIPVSFTIGRTGLLVDNGWDDKYPVWTSERLQRVITPLLRQ